MENDRSIQVLCHFLITCYMTHAIFTLYIKEDEIETLQAIYGDDFRLVTTAGSGSNVYSITISSPDCQCISVQVNIQTTINFQQDLLFIVNVGHMSS